MNFNCFSVKAAKVIISKLIKIPKKGVRFLSGYSFFIELAEKCIYFRAVKIKLYDKKFGLQLEVFGQFLGLELSEYFQPYVPIVREIKPIFTTFCMKCSTLVYWRQFKRAYSVFVTPPYLVFYPPCFTSTLSTFGLLYLHMFGATTLARFSYHNPRINSSWPATLVDQERFCTVSTLLEMYLSLLSFNFSRKKTIDKT